MSTSNYRYEYLRFSQPLGDFLLTTIPAVDLLKVYSVNPRAYKGDTPDGTQRGLSQPRVNEIAKYTATQDAAFPTAIVIALLPDQYSIEDPNASSGTVEIKDKVEVIDGQHRIEGLAKAAREIDATIPEKFLLPCVLVVEPTDEQKAFIFATINGKQTKVNSSIVADLFGESSSKDPGHVLHIVARSLNFKEDSPFRDRLKMLGVKSPDKETESLTQGTFIRELMKHVSRNPMLDRNMMRQGKELEKMEDLVLRDYIVKGKGDLLIPLVQNIFKAVQHVWPTEWENHNEFNLSKTTGFTGIMKGIGTAINYGKQKGVLTEKYFTVIFEEMKAHMSPRRFVNEEFPAGGIGENRIRDLVEEAYKRKFPDDSLIEQLR